MGNKRSIETAVQFKHGWRDAGAEVARSPLADIMRGLHPQIHEDRIVSFIEAYINGEKPDPENFKEPVVVALPAKGGHEIKP